MNTSFLFFPKNAVRNTAFGLLATIMSVPAQAQQYRFAAGTHIGSFGAVDAPKSSLGPEAAQVGGHASYNVSKRWSVGISATWWAEVFCPYLNEDPRALYVTEDNGYYDRTGSVT